MLVDNKSFLDGVSLSIKYENKSVTQTQRNHNSMEIESHRSLMTIIDRNQENHQIDQSVRSFQ